MTFAAVGGALFNDQTVAWSLTPGTVGDLIMAEVINVSNATSTCTALSSTNVTWTASTTLTGSTNANTAAIFFGKVTSTSTATVTLTWSSTTPTTIRIAAQEFSSTVGSWALDTSGHLDGAGTNVWPSLTPAGSGELYWGFALDSGSATAGTTSGYTYDIDATHSNGMGFNPACGAAATGPTWGDGGHFFGIMQLIKETSGANPAGSVQPRATVPVPRHRPRRARWAGGAGQAFVFVPPPLQEFRLAPRRRLARAQWRGGFGSAYVFVPPQPQQPKPAPRRRPARAVVRFTPVATTNATAAPVNGQTQPLMTRPVPRRRTRQRAFVKFTPIATFNRFTPPIPSGVIFGAQGGAGGDRDPEVRMFRTIMPGEIPVSGSALPKLHGRGYVAPPPERADDVEHLWEEPKPPPEPPGPTPAEVARREAQRAAGALYDLGRIIAPEPYVPPSRVRCGALRKIGTETLRCAKKRGHPGMHADRGVKWG